MAEAERVQWRHGVRRASAFLFLAFVALIDVVVLREPVGTDPADPLISLSAVPPVVLWISCLRLAYARRRVASAVRHRWALGCALLWVHIAIAFHLGHGWSYRAAWEHTRQVGGYGDGVFVNYAFALVWLCDSVWALVASASYRARPRWLHWAIHGYMAFVVVNAAVVFAGWEMRLVFLGWVTIIALLVWYTRRRDRATHEPET